MSYTRCAKTARAAQRCSTRCATTSCAKSTSTGAALSVIAPTTASRPGRPATSRTGSASRSERALLEHARESVGDVPPRGRIDAECLLEHPPELDHVADALLLAGAVQLMDTQHTVAEPEASIRGHAGSEQPGAKRRRGVRH